MVKLEGKFASANVMMDKLELEESCVKQIQEILDSPCSSGSHIAIMPDAHTGVGCCVGFTQRIADRIVPNFIGVDIGCSILTYMMKPKESRKLNFEKIDKIIKQLIPNGKAQSRKVHLKEAESIPYDRLTTPINKVKIMNGVGTLGGGNHFIEIDVDDQDNYYLVIHSGSRHLGATVWEYWQKIAASKRPEGVPEHLAWLEGEDMENYIKDVLVCQQYSLTNKEAMADIILDELGIKKKDCDIFLAQHNYYDQVDKIIRKGAICGGSYTLIPFNMKDGGMIVCGTSREEFNWSLPHGAGRRMSRADARNTLSMQEFKTAMKGIYSSSINVHTIDESPMAYKDTDFIINNVKEYCTMLKKIRPVYNFKSGD